jgi:TPR repeat protein
MNTKKRCCILLYETTPLKRPRISLKSENSLVRILRERAKLLKVKADDECAICWDKLGAGDVVSLPCKHNFHEGCIVNLRKSEAARVCPLCRAPLFDEPLADYASIERRVKQGGGSWSALSEWEQSAMQFARRKFSKSAKEGYPAAQCFLGVMLENGQGTAKNEARAVEWFRKAALQGDADAQCKLGAKLVSGRCIAKNETEAVIWFQKAAEQGHANAQFNYGIMLANGEGISKNEVEAVKWLRKAAEQGDADAQYNLGVLLEVLTAKNEVEAAKWFRKAAEQRDAEAQCSLGSMLANGRGTSKNDVESVKWYRKAAEKGYALAQLGLRACKRLWPL